MVVGERVGASVGGPHPPPQCPVEGTVMGSAPHLPQNPFLRKSEGGHLDLLGRNAISEVYIYYILIKVHLFSFNSAILWALPFPHLQPLTVLSSLVFKHTTPFFRHLKGWWLPMLSVTHRQQQRVKGHLKSYWG